MDRKIGFPISSISTYEPSLTERLLGESYIEANSLGSTSHLVNLRNFA